jgi:hypothetical protein
MEPPDPDLSTKQQTLPRLSRQALHRIVQAEKDAEERYYRDTAPLYPTSPDFSFFEADILRALERVLQYLRLFAEEVLDAHLREYLEAKPSALLSNPALLESVERTVLVLADQLWSGCTAALFLEPGSRQARHERAMTERTLGPHSEPERGRYPNPEQWANTWRRLTEPDSEMERLDTQRKATVKAACANLIPQYQHKAASRLGVELRPIVRSEKKQEGQIPRRRTQGNIAPSQPIEARTAQARARSSTHTDASMELSGRVQGDQVREPPPLVLSERDAKVHDIVGGDNFYNLTNADIMKDSGIRKRLRTDCKLEAGSEAAKACLDRIRRGKGYPLSREITKKRSTRN